MSTPDIVAAGPGPQTGLDDHIYNRLLKERIIFLGSDVRDDNANAICAQMLLLAAEDPEKDIWLYINSPGGSVTAGMAIFDTMQWIPNDVATVAMGMAADIKIQAEQLLHIKRQMAELIAQHTGQSVDQIEKDSDRDRWFTASEAKDYGFVDHVFTSAADGPKSDNPVTDK